MHTGRRYRPRGGKSAKRKKLREAFAPAFENRLSGILSDSASTSSVAKAPIAVPSAKPNEAPKAKVAPSQASKVNRSSFSSGAEASSPVVDLTSKALFPAAAFDEISSEEEVEELGPGGQAIDYGSAKRLREISLGVDQAVFDLRPWIPGRVIVNKVAFQSQEDGSLLLDSVEDLFESLKGCVILDLYKTVIFPERLSSGDSIKLAEHRGELQTIDRKCFHSFFSFSATVSPSVRVPTLDVRRLRSTSKR